MPDPNPTAPFAPALDTDTVDVRWLAVPAPEGAATARLCDSVAIYLDDDERIRAARFHFARDRHAYVLAHALARATLSLHAPRAPQDWRFSASAHGRPEIVGDARTPALRFNISHTRGLVAVAVTLDRDIGVDVETVDAARLSMDLAARTFAPREVAHLRTLPPGDLPEALFAFWTLKEAYIKAVGRGLSLPLDGFAYDLAPDLTPVAIHFSDAVADDPACWHFERQRPTATHALALAVRHPVPARVRVRTSALDGAGLLALCRQMAEGPGRISRT